MTSRSGQSDAPQAVPKRLLAIGTTIDSGVIVVFWVASAVILGLFVLLTRGKVTIIEEQTVRLREGLWLVSCTANIDYIYLAIACEEDCSDGSTDQRLHGEPDG